MGEVPLVASKTVDISNMRLIESERLTGMKNFIIWKQSVMNHLFCYDLLEAVQVQLPDTNQKNKFAFLFIVNSLSEERRCLLPDNCYSAFRLFKVICDKYENPDRVSLVVLWRKLRDIEIDMNNLQDFIDKSTAIFRVLATSEIKLTEELFVQEILTRLSYFISYNVIGPVLDTKGFKLEVLNYLVQEAKRQAHTSNQTTKNMSTCLKATVKKCTHCSKTGHLVDECFKLHPEKCWWKQKEAKPENKSEKPEKSSYAKASSAFQSLVEPEKNENFWLIDSGASKHFCRDLRLMTEVQTTEAVEIEIADGTKCWSSKKGLVKFETENFIIRIEVLFVPEFGSNLFSIDSAEQAGMKISFENGTFNFFGKNGDYFFKSVKIQGSRYLDVSYASNNSSTEHAKVSQANQWHLKLGHVSQHRHQILSNLHSEVPPPSHGSCVDCCVNKITKPVFKKTWKNINSSFRSYTFRCMWAVTEEFTWLHILLDTDR